MVFHIGRLCKMPSQEQGTQTGLGRFRSVEEGVPFVLTSQSADGPEALHQSKRTKATSGLHQ